MSVKSTLRLPELKAGFCSGLTPSTSLRASSEPRFLPRLQRWGLARSNGSSFDFYNLGDIERVLKGLITSKEGWNSFKNSF